MESEVAGFVLAAGSGTRLRPLTELRPKALCPINNKALVDYAVERCSGLVGDVRVNSWHKRDQMLEHFASTQSAQLVVEAEPLGTAGALAANKDWIGERAVLVHNADAWHADPLSEFVSDWDGQRVRLLVTKTARAADFGSYRFCGVSLMPWELVKHFDVRPSGLWEACWRHLSPQQLDLVEIDGPYFDCGTPADYLDANLATSGGASVIGPGAVIEGSVESSVVWQGARVGKDEKLSRIIRPITEITVDARRVLAAEPRELAKAVRTL